MHVFFEDDGAFKAGTILADNDTSLQVETAHGKRVKIKAGSVLLRFDTPAPIALLDAGHAAAAALDPNFLWEVCGHDEFGFHDLAREYYGRAPSAAEAAGTAMCLHANPMHFYKKGKGRYKAAPADSLKSALASVEKKRLQAEQINSWVVALKQHELPDALRAALGMLLYAPDKNTLEWKALAQACDEEKTNPVALLAQCGALASTHDYHFNRFLHATSYCLEAFMRKWFLILAMGILFVFPSTVAAQNNIAFTNVSVQLWPEYDQPSMLVITDFAVAANTKFPASVTFRIPQDANLIAVAAYKTDGNLVDAVFDGPKTDGEWKSFTITLDSTTARFEYYQPITFNGNQRVFSYLWDGTYAVDVFNIRVLEPLDTTSLTTTPQLASISQENNLKYFVGNPVRLAAGEQFTLNLDYKKSSDALITSSSQGVQPVAPVNENTPGRVSLNNYLPYILGFLGIVMIVGGFAYYWQAGRGTSKKPRRRAQSNVESEENDEESYCPQCGTRAKPGDRFCRVCGGRIRHQEE
jgi:hypothetical protein